MNIHVTTKSVFIYRIEQKQSKSEEKKRNIISFCDLNILKR